MSVDAALTAIQNSAVAHVISKSDHLVAAGLQIAHILGFVILLGSLVLISLRLLGLVFNQQPIERVARDSIRLLWIGLGIAVVSGTLMFVSSPKLYFYNWAFELKMLLFVFAVVLQVSLFRKVVANKKRGPVFARISVTVSLVAWFAIGMAGRAIGFV